MPKLFSRKSVPKVSKTGTGPDLAKDPLNLRSREVKELNKPYDLKTHFVGVIDLCSTETHFTDLILKLINRTSQELKDSSSRKRNKNGTKCVSDERHLLQEDDSASSEDDEGFGPSLPCESVKEFERSVLTFNFSELLMRLGVPAKAPDAYTADAELFKTIFRDNLEWKVLDEEGSYIFRALLPTKDTDKTFRLQHWLAGFLVVIDSENSGECDQQLVTTTNSESRRHFECEHLLRTLKSFKPVLTYSRIVNNMFKKSSTEVRKPALVFINSTGASPQMCPSNDNLENLPSACLTCLEIKSTYECFWAGDVTSACCVLANQDIFKLFPEVIRLLNMKMSGLY